MRCRFSGSKAFRKTLAAVLLLFFATLTYANHARAAQYTNKDIVTGGRLYDSWYEQLLLNPPESRHPSYPVDGPARGADTWRCVTCHGWDYRGSDGAATPHRMSEPLFTGISGSAGASTDRIRAVLMDEVHQFSEDLMSPRALDALAAFVSAGQIDVDFIIDAKDRRARGTPKKGSQPFKTVCALCHGLQGDALPLESGGVRKTLGTVARFDPWRVLHKMRFGHPGAYMAGFANYSTSELGDILAYIQARGINRTKP